MREIRTMSCSLCNGTGWKHVDHDGRTAVTRCDCWRATLADKLLEDARIPRRYQHCDLDHFVTYGNESLEQAVKQARWLVANYFQTTRGLFLLGQPGVGKTHLAVAVLKGIVQQHRVHGLFYDLSQLLRVIRSTYNPAVRTSESDVLVPVMTADLLVLDDLGREKTSEWVEETLNLIVNTRYNERRLTLFTSNYDIIDDADPDSLQARVGYRMYSRLHEMCELVHLSGADYRELPLNGGVDDLHALWKLRKRPRGRPAPAPAATKRPAAEDRGRDLPSRSTSQARARLSPEPPGVSIDLKWAGGKIETKK
jgi:DNA replication protein DnaC